MIRSEIFLTEDKIARRSVRMIPTPPMPALLLEALHTEAVNRVFAERLCNDFRVSGLMNEAVSLNATNGNFKIFEVSNGFFA